MATESFRFITPARVKVSLVPLGDIAAPDFRRYCESISSVSDIRLLDVSPIPECHHFNPQEFSQGRVFYSISQNSPSDESAFLDDFEPFRKTFIIIGIGSHSHSQDHDGALRELRTRFPTAVSHNIVLYQSPEDTNVHDEVFHVSASAEKITITVETLMCGVTRNFLRALDSYATSHESITLRSPISLTDSSVLTRTINRAQKRLSSGQAFKTSFVNGQNVSPSTKDSKTKSSQRQNGRQAKLMGNFFLLAGRSQDALQYFTDAAINAKKADDHLWLASALEGLAVSALVLSFLGLPFQVQNPMFTSVLQLPKSKGVSLIKANSKISMESMVSRQSVSGTPRNSTSSSLSLSGNQGPQNTDMTQIQLVEFLLLLASRSSSYYKLSTIDIDDCVPDLVYIESLLRNIKLMVTIHLSQTVEVSAIVEALVGLRPVSKQPEGAEFELPRKTIIAEIDQIFALQIDHLEITQQCRIFCALASIYHDLGFNRKHGLVLRFLLETLTSKASMVDQNPKSAFPSSSLKALIETIFGIYHINTDTEKSSSMSSANFSNWIILQLSLIKVCLRIAEAFRDYDTLMKLCVLTLSRFVHCLPADDQIKLKDKLSWLRLITNNDSYDLQIPHPDPFMVRDAKFLVPSGAKTLVPLKAEQFNAAPKPADAKPAFFDPYAESPKPINMDSIVCQNEKYQLKVTLQNPFFFPLEIQAIDIVTEQESSVETLTSSARLIAVSPLEQTRETSNQGWKNVAKKLPNNDHKQTNAGEDVILPPSSSADVTIEFRPLVPGPIQIKGFDIVIENSGSQFFCIVDREQFHGLEKLNHNITRKPAKASYALDDLFQQLVSEFAADRVTTKVVSLTAIHAQPKLMATNLQKIDDWAMLLEGERRSSSTSLKNCSDVAINYLSISPWDSTIESISSRLNSNALNAAEVYELEWSLLERKAVIITNKEEISSLYNVIQPGGELIIRYDVSGKKSMTESKLILEYGRKIPGFQDTTFVRKLVVPFNVSVHRSLGIISSDILSIFPSLWQSGNKARTSMNSSYGRALNKILDFVSRIQADQKQNISDFCILSLDVKNFWKDSLVAKIEVLTAEIDYTIEETILPNKTARLFVPIKRVNEKVLNPLRNIPSLRNKQFIKNYNLSEEEEQQTRRSFWVRDELLKCIRGTWLSNNVSASRCGEIDLRQIRLSTPMTDLLAYDDLSIYHSILSDETSERVMQLQDNKFVLEREKFYTLKTRIVNHTERTISGILRHVPFPLNATNKQDLSIDSKILYNGVLQTHIGGDTIGPGMSAEKVLGFMILEKGSYEWGCIFDAAGEGEKRTIGREPAYIVAL